MYACMAVLDRRLATARMAGDEPSIEHQAERGGRRSNEQAYMLELSETIKLLFHYI